MESIHTQSSDLAGKVVRLKDERTLTITDYWDVIKGTSWRDSEGNLVDEYKERMRLKVLPDDEEVYLGTIEGTDILINRDEIVPEDL